MGLRSKPERMMSWVRSLVWVIQQAICAGCISRCPLKLNTGISDDSPPAMPSPGCSRHWLKSMVRPSKRGGVPVFKRPCGSFSSFNRADKRTAGGSPARPAEWFCKPTWILPSKKVPAVSTTAFAAKRTPTCVTAPTTLEPSIIRSSTACWNNHRLGWFSS